ncbi:MAG: DUF1549 and DUF1553 domain-containing protein [Pirellulaceae bacterium]
MKRLILVVILGMPWGAITGQAGEVQEVESAAVRWSEQGDGGVPQFGRHILPMIGKLGCNNRACHGSFQGQNGFRLSLFGSDPGEDHKSLTTDESGDGPRVNVEDPDASLALYKPTHGDEHGGGERMKVGGWQHRMFRAWVAGGAPFRPDEEARIEKLEITPRELVLGVGQQPAALRLRAYFSDGTVEDVTPLTIFTSRDEGTAAVSESGEVAAVRPGDTAIVAAFGPEVTSCQILAPRAEEAAAITAEWTTSEIDRLVFEKLQNLRIRPSELAADEVFLRRAYLDVIGTLPKVDEVRQFLEDTRPDKRRRLIDALLERPEYSKYWGMIFSDITGNQGINPHPQVSHLWQSWLAEKLRQNWSYDKIVGGILTATSLEGRPREQLLAEIEAVRENIGADPETPYRWTSKYDSGVYARRETLDLYWLRIPNRQPDRVALQTSAAFLGVRLDCAQCHKHPFDRWTQQDFEQFQSFFRVMEYRYAPTGGPLPGKGQIAYGRDEVVVGLNDRYQNLVKRYPPKLLGGEELSYEKGDPDPRAALWQWMRKPDNPYFAPSIVNRIWAHYFGVGLVEPLEDFSSGNPPSNPKLLEHLASDFIEHDFDLKHLHRRILNSRTYQLSWETNDSNRLDQRNYSHALLRRMPAEVLVHAIGGASGVPFEFKFTPPGSLPIEYASTLRMPYPLELFGRGIRKQTCGNCERTNEPALNQALYLLTDAEIVDRITAEKGRLKELLSTCEDDARAVEELYLAALSRPPTEGELRDAVDYRRECESRAAWMEDLLWSLLNVREFIFVH